LYFEIKSVSDKGVIVGYASPYGNEDLQGEIVCKGAFDNYLKSGNNQVPLLWQHDIKEVIGLGLVEDSEKGLRITAQLNLEVQKAKEAYSLLQQKAINGLSIGHNVVKDEWKKGVRYLKELKLWEVSVVTFPANP